jgi:hypothetical protein
MKFFSALFFVIVLFSQASAQDKFGKGYYVTNNGDTIRGYVEHRSVYRKDVGFRAALKEPVKNLTPKDAAAFGFDSGFAYLRVHQPSKENANGDSVFVRPILQGEIDVYSYAGKVVIGSEKKGRFPLGKKSSNAAESVKNKQSAAVAYNVVFQDCPSVRAEAQNAPITKESIVKLVASYHDCRGLSYTEAKAVKEKRMVDIGFFAGLFSPKLSIGPWASDKKEDTYEFKFQNSSSATFGFAANFGARSPSPVFAFQTGLAFAKGEHQGRWTITDNALDGTPVQVTRIASVDYSRMTINAGARISVRSNVVNPYFSFGFNYHRYLSVNERQLVITQINSSVEQEEVPLGMQNYSVGGYATVGLRRKIGQTKALFAECSFERSYIGLEYWRDLAKLTSMSLRFGFLF